MNRKRASLAAAFTAVTLATGAIAVTATSASAAGTVTASFSRSAWETGYTATYTISNDSDQATSDWTVEFDLPSGTTLGAYWDALMSQSGNHVTAKARDYNKVVPKGGKTTFGFNAQGTGVPANCKINGASCSGGSA